MGCPSSMSLENAGPLTVVRHVLGLWADVATGYDGIERRLAAGAWDGFEEIAKVIAALEQELKPLLFSIAETRASGYVPTDELAAAWYELDARVAALTRRQQQLAVAAMSARDTTAARLVRTRIARSRAAGYTPLNPLTPRFASTRV
jgi:hypothetical protein